MNSSYYVLGAEREDGAYTYFTADGRPTPSLELAYKYTNLGQIKEDEVLMTKSISQSYGRFLELVSENALLPIYAPGVREIHQLVYDKGLTILEITTRIEVVK